MSPLPLFPTSVVGSFPRPDAVRALFGKDDSEAQLDRLKVNHLTMEFTTPAAGDMAVFKDLREDLEIGLGCVSCDTRPNRFG